MSAYPITYIVSLLIFWTSCNAIDTEEIENVKPQLNLVIVDSIQINYLGSPTVHDLNPKTGDVLFMEYKESSAMIHIADYSGEVQRSFSKSGDFPDSYGTLLTSLLLNSDSTFLAYGTKGLLTYYLDGELLSMVNSSRLYFTGSFRYGMGNGLQAFGETLLLANLDIGREVYSDLDKLKGVKNVIWIDGKTGQEQKIIQPPEESLFLNGSYFFLDAWQPVLTVQDDQLYIAFGTEPSIYTYALNDSFTLLNKVDLELPGFRGFTGFNQFRNDMKFIGLRETVGRIKNIKLFKEFILVSYFPGFNQGDTEERFINKSHEEASLFRENMNQKYQHRLAVFNRSGELIYHFIPEQFGILGSSMLVRNEQLWVMEKPDAEVEKDNFKLYRIDLLEN
jgi:hypothetical protein